MSWLTHPPLPSEISAFQARVISEILYGITVMKFGSPECLGYERIAQRRQPKVLDVFGGLRSQHMPEHARAPASLDTRRLSQSRIVN